MYAPHSSSDDEDDEQLARRVAAQGARRQRRRRPAAPGERAQCPAHGWWWGVWWWLWWGRGAGHGAAAWHVWELWDTVARGQSVYEKQMQKTGAQAVPTPRVHSAWALPLVLPLPLSVASRATLTREPPPPLSLLRSAHSAGR